MKVIVRPAELYCTAVRVPRCAACGVRLERDERDFWLPRLAPEPLTVTVGALMERVAAWKATPVACFRCPERVVAR